MSSPLHDRLAANLAAVEERIQSACRRAGRTRDDVRLVAVIKYAEWDWILGLADLGIRDFAENRPQQLEERAARLDADRPGHGVHWHMIGHLQRNKVRPVLPIAALIHSVDSLRLLERIDLLAAEMTLAPQVLLEVNVSGEASKDGFSPDELRSHWEAITGLRHVAVRGLMTMAPASDDPEAARPTFTGLRQLRDELQLQSPAAMLTELSMGMSGDFETAIEAGATLIRIGSSLFDGCEGLSAR